MRRLGRKLMVPAVGLLVAGGGFAFMANNTVPETQAGSGQATIAGYAASNVHYQVVNNGPGPGSQAIVAVSFTLNGPANTVFAYINGTSYGNCTASKTVTDGWSCQANNLNGEQELSTATVLQVSAAQ
ncbi:MAG: hypothetical protein ACRD0J_18735 [Acidimicrobiales bacterium]